MSWFTTYVRSSIGAKQIVGITGLLLIGYIIAHLLGNLQIFLGPDAINEYGVSLREMGGGALIWVARAGLLAVFVVHIAMTMRLAVLNRAARPVRYRKHRSMRTKFYSRTMATSGLLLLAFVVYHLMHFTYGYVLGDYFVLQDEQGRHDVYSMVVLSFQHWPVTISYLVALAFLFMHLAHGASSWFQSVGFNHPKYNGFIGKFGPWFATIMFIGYASIPAAIVLGLIDLPGA